MVDPPRLAPETEAMPGAVYSPFADRIAGSDGPIFPLHVGDTWRDPFVGARSEDISSADFPRLHAYGNTRGLPELVTRVCEKLRERNGLSHVPEEILITAGATGGLATLAGATLSPGDEILILAPFWPLIRGIAQSFRATPVEVPFFDRVATRAEAVAAVESKITSRSRVLYVSTPSNPTGRVIPGDWLEALADLARRHDLWIFSDEVYEDYVYTGEHVSMARFAPERSVSVFSVSKSYAMAGQRVGYLAGPSSIISQARKIGTHIYYHAPIVGQRTALAAIEGGDTWIESARHEYQATGEQVAKILGLPTPDGGTFLFLDVRDRLDERGLHGLLEDCFEQRVLVAPGLSCGEAYGEWIRLSYTAVPPEDVLEAASRLASVLGRR
ncbi:MAG: aminotransferase class I/II-fold pyridoxal phosphate-dependent enzyme [Proteobacteria bacterium]|nr:aminotransferase class I/II-fold pyridoxal phosphate-dependent enzyme [Pseudomonadota bacterium]